MRGPRLVALNREVVAVTEKLRQHAQMHISMGVVTLPVTRTLNTGSCQWPLVSHCRAR